MRVRYSPRAAEDLENIRRYIGKNSQTSAWVVASFDSPFHCPARAVAAQRASDECALACVGLSSPTTLRRLLRSQLTER